MKHKTVSLADQVFERLEHEILSGVYQRGETLPAPDGLSGFCLVTLDGLALGFGKASDGQVKNHYPKGLRR